MKCSKIVKHRWRTREFPNIWTSNHPQYFDYEFLIHSVTKKKITKLPVVGHQGDLPENSLKMSHVLNLSKWRSNRVWSSFSGTHCLAFSHFLHFIFVHPLSDVTDLPWVVIPVLLQKMSHCTFHHKKIRHNRLYLTKKRGIESGTSAQWI